MNDHEAVTEAAERIAAAIGRRDLDTVRELLAPGFVHRSFGGAAVDAEAFLRGLEQIPGEILSVRLEQVAVDSGPTGALLTGLQHARVLLQGQTIDDRRAFVDWFVKQDGAWRIQAAVDLPVPGSAG